MVWFLHYLCFRRPLARSQKKWLWYYDMEWNCQDYLLYKNGVSTSKLAFSIEDFLPVTFPCCGAWADLVFPCWCGLFILYLAQWRIKPCSVLCCLSIIKASLCAKVTDFQVFAYKRHFILFSAYWYITRESIHNWKIQPGCCWLIPSASHQKCWLGTACILTYICLPFLTL